LKVLVTGGTGFIGSALVPALLARGFQVRIGARERTGVIPGAECYPLGNLATAADWTGALEGTEAVVHLAGVAHRFKADADYDDSLYDRVNHRATFDLVKTIRDQGWTGRFAFASTVRVHGDAPALPVRPDSPYAPATPYDQSKMEAESAIREQLGESAAHWAIFRPVLVYGPGQRANMAKLEGMVRRGWPIPLGRPNRKSFLFVGNLVDAFLTYLASADPPSGKAWLVADCPPASTEALVRAMGRAMGREARVIHPPQALMTLLAQAGDLLGRLGLPMPWTSETQARLQDDLYVDTRVIAEELGWSPRFTLEEGMRLTYCAKNGEGPEGPPPRIGSWLRPRRPSGPCG